MHDACPLTFPSAPPASAGLLQRRWGWLLAPVLSLVMLGSRFAHWRSEERASSERREIDLRVAADRMAYNLADRMASYELVLRGLRGTSKAPERIDREEFQTYVSSLQLQEVRPGLQGISLILKLSQGSCPRISRTCASAAFLTTPSAHRGAALYAAVTHIEPLDADNQRALGLDAYAIPTARDALERAADTGVLAVSGMWPWSKTLCRPKGLVMYPAHSCQGCCAGKRRAAPQRFARLGVGPVLHGDVIAGLSREFEPDIALM